MTRPLIVIGDRTDHGGTVVGSSAVTDTNGKRIARVGDKVTCPRKGHGGTTVIVTGDPTFIIDGQPAARHGDKCACGATLLSSQAETVVDTAGGSGGAGASSSSSFSNGATSSAAAASDYGGSTLAAAQSSQATIASSAAATNEEKQTEKFDEQVKLEPVAAESTGLPWFIETRDGRTFNGRANADGSLPRIETTSSDDYTVYWGDEALAKKAGQGAA